MTGCVVANILYINQAITLKSRSLNKYINQFTAKHTLIEQGVATTKQPECTVVHEDCVL